MNINVGIMDELFKARQAMIYSLELEMARIVINLRQSFEPHQEEVRKKVNI